MAKFIFVTGGVVSGLGKGITAASLGRLLKCRGLKVASQKLDPYVNVDPGTMSPLQHGEVFVTDDGTETDLDLGHYERFIDENLNKYSNLTTGKVYWNVLNKERQGAYLGQTVQIIPHITNEIKSYIYNLASSTEADVVITEIGGTTGDIESQPFLEAIRQVGLAPILSAYLSRRSASPRRSTGCFTQKRMGGVRRLRGDSPLMFFYYTICFRKSCHEHGSSFFIPKPVNRF